MDDNVKKQHFKKVDKDRKKEKRDNLGDDENGNRRKRYE